MLYHILSWLISAAKSAFADQLTNFVVHGIKIGWDILKKVLTTIFNKVRATVEDTIEEAIKQKPNERPNLSEMSDLFIKKVGQILSGMFLEFITSLVRDYTGIELPADQNLNLAAPAQPNLNQVAPAC